VTSFASQIEEFEKHHEYEFILKCIFTCTDIHNLIIERRITVSFFHKTFFEKLKTRRSKNSNKNSIQLSNGISKIIGGRKTITNINIQVKELKRKY
jgi:hypothetical protein